MTPKACTFFNAAAVFATFLMSIWIAPTSRFFAYDGLLSIDTWVDVAHDGPALVTAFGFRDDAALERFVDDPALDQLARDFDAFAGPHGHRVVRTPPIYRAATLSAERPAAPAP